MAEKYSRDQANRQPKLGLVWRNRKKISQIIKDYFCLLFCLLIILWFKEMKRKVENKYPFRDRKGLGCIKHIEKI
jgi:hypothetical protein